MARRSGGLFAHHVPGRSPVHRAPLGLKVALVVAVGASTWLVPSWRGSLAVLAVPAALTLVARIRPGRVARSLVAIAPVLVLLGLFQVVTRGAGDAVKVVSGILACYLAGGLVTATTPVTEMVDGVVRLARPARRWVDPEVVALTLGVMLRSVPWVAGAFGGVRESARARGLERSPRAVVAPVAVHVVAYGRRTGEALAARGLTDPAPSPPDDGRRPAVR